MVDANAAFARREFPIARRLYELAASDTSWPNEAAAPGLQALARFRLLLLHALLDEDDLARSVLEDIQEQDASTPYARLGQFFWHTYGMTNDIAATCAQVTEFARREPAVLEPLNVPGAPEFRAEDLCQTPDVGR